MEHQPAVPGDGRHSSPMQRISQADIDEMRARGDDPSILSDAEAWLDICKRADDLIDRVDRAFDVVALGDGIGLRESDGIDNYADSERLRELRASDEKIDWRRIPADLLNYCHAAPSFLDAKGIRFHLPAFLIAELRGESDGIIDRLIYNSFADPGFIKLLTPEQRHAIIACISFYGSIERFCYDAKDIRDAILRYSKPD